MARTTASARTNSSPIVEPEDKLASHVAKLHASNKVRRKRTVAVGSRAVVPEESDTARKYTPGEIAECRRRIEFLYINGDNTRRIQDKLLKGVPSFNVSTTFIKRIVDDVRLELAKDADENREHYKNTQIRRLYRHLALASEQKDLNAIAKFEAQLADLQGTRDAVKVEHTVHQTKAMQIVFTNIDDASLLRELHEALEEERLLNAAKAKQLTVGAIDAEIVSS